MSEGNGRKALLVVGIAVVERGRRGAERSCRPPLRGRCWSISFIPYFGSGFNPFRSDGGRGIANEEELVCPGPE